MSNYLESSQLVLSKPEGLQIPDSRNSCWTFIKPQSFHTDIVAKLSKNGEMTSTVDGKM